jgi:hypothetical protein
MVGASSALCQAGATPDGDREGALCHLQPMLNTLAELSDPGRAGTTPATSHLERFSRRGTGVEGFFDGGGEAVAR